MSYFHPKVYTYIIFKSNNLTGRKEALLLIKKATKLKNKLYKDEMM